MKESKITRAGSKGVLIVTFITFLLAYTLSLECVRADNIWYEIENFSQKETVKPEGTPYKWYNAGREETVWMSVDEIAVFFQRGSMVSKERMETLARTLDTQGTPLEGSNEFVMFVQVIDTASRYVTELIDTMLKQHTEVKEVSPVFYRGGIKDPLNRMALTGEVIIHFPPEWDESRVNGLAKRYGLSYIKGFDFSPDTRLFSAGSALQSLEVANEIQFSGEVIYAYPNWFKTMAKRAIPNDPLFPNQWHLNNTGQSGGTAGEDVNIMDVWDIYKGSANEIIAIVDDGLETGHEDLSGNILPGYHYDWVDGDTDPNPGPDDNHGTAVAGVAAASGFSSLGVTGAAPLAKLIGYRLSGASTDANEADAMVRNKDVVDISNNSWGPTDCINNSFNSLGAPGPLMEDAWLNGVNTGRGGKGIIYVWANGNGAQCNNNSNFDGYANSRYTIAVAASTNLGKKASYSEVGANIFVNAPSNGGTLSITTTDRTGSAGYAPGNYTDTFGGTSSSAPLVSGIIALMLEANPNLTWRDVQHILITTAEKNDPAETGWTTNGAGYHINHKYGFGRVNAQSAVEAAETWNSVGPEVNVEKTAAPNLPIPDNNACGVSSTIMISENINVEYVEVFFTAADHTFWGDLMVTLTSPSGTKSILAHRVDNIVPGSYSNWRFGSVRHFGESSIGTWTLTVKDLASVDVGTFQSWKLKIFGTEERYTNLRVVRHSDNTIWAMKCEATSICSQWWQISGRFSVQPTLTWDRSVQKYILMGIGNDQASIWRSTFNANGTWNNDWTKITGASPSPVAVAGGGFGSPAPSKTNLTVVRHGDNTIWSMACEGTGTCSQWTQIGGKFSVQPTLTWDPSIQKYILMGIGNDRASIWRSTFNADGTWNNDWIKITGASPSPVAVAGGGFGGPVPQSKTNLTVVRHGDNTIWSMACEGTGTCSQWTQIGGKFSVQPTLTWDPSIQKYILEGIGNDQASIWRSTFDADGTWNNDWTKIPGASPSPVAVAGGGFTTGNDPKAGDWCGSIIQFNVSTDGKKITHDGSAIMDSSGNPVDLCLGWVPFTGACSGQTKVCITISPATPIIDNYFSLSAGGWIIYGSFTSNSSSNGTYSLSRYDPICQGTITSSGTWSASH